MGKAFVADDVLTRLADRLARRLRVEALILFGSRAQGVAGPESDYDLVVVSPEFEGVPFLQRGRVLLSCREPGAAYDFLCYTPEEFEELVNQATLVREVARTGVWLKGDPERWLRRSGPPAASAG